MLPNNPFRRSFLLVAALLTLLHILPAQSPRLAEVAVPLAGTDPTLSNADLMPLKELLQDRCFVAVGEATHGTHEFFQMKHRMFRFLVEECGYRTFAIEANFSECLELNRYVQTGEGDPRDGINAMYFWTWNTEEVLALVEWMRKWNVDHPKEVPLQFLGFDMQVVKGPARGVMDFLEAHWPAMYADHRALLAEMAASNPSKIDRARGLEWRKAAPVIQQKIFDSAADHCPGCSDRELREVEMHARVLVQATQGIGTELPYNRDSCMAENCRRLLDQFTEPGGKMMLWAHNGHIQKTSFSPVYRKQGDWLKEWYGAKYYAIGFDFDRGSFGAYCNGSFDNWTVDEAPKGSVGAVFRSLPSPHYFADLSKAIPAELERELSMRSVGAVYDTENEARFFHNAPPASFFDGIIFIRETTAARNLKGAAQYRASARYKTSFQLPAVEELRLQARVRVQGGGEVDCVGTVGFLGPSPWGSWRRIAQSDTVFAGEGWQEMVLEHGPLPDKAFLTIDAVLVGRGSLDIDDVQLEYKVGGQWNAVPLKHWNFENSPKALSRWKMTSRSFQQVLFEGPSKNHWMRIQSRGMEH